jgi:hypothetical protein
MALRRASTVWAGCSLALGVLRSRQVAPSSDRR